ncbi:hypothetical protein [Paraburkholderia sp. GAS32]|uniref:hypothetical protein n=1 Tax=Paraburkholderia sp. GAS32 TaxID=3035129 RepID=UPI003D209155
MTTEQNTDPITPSLPVFAVDPTQLHLVIINGQGGELAQVPVWRAPSQQAVLDEAAARGWTVSFAVDMPTFARLTLVALDSVMNKKRERLPPGVTKTNHEFMAEGIAGFAEFFMAWGTRDGKPTNPALGYARSDDERNQVVGRMQAAGFEPGIVMPLQLILASQANLLLVRDGQAVPDYEIVSTSQAPL